MFYKHHLRSIRPCFWIANSGKGSLRIGGVRLPPEKKNDPLIAGTQWKASDNKESDARLLK